MNKDTFLQFIGNSRDCEQFNLDNAVNRGLYKFKNDRIDSKKIFKLAAACVFTFFMCITITLIPLKTIVDEYYQNRNNSMPGSAEVLVGYINNITSNFKIFIGDE